MKGSNSTSNKWILILRHIQEESKRAIHIAIVYKDLGIKYGYTIIFYYRVHEMYTIYVLDRNVVKVEYPRTKKLLPAPVLLEGLLHYNLYIFIFLP